MWLEDPEYPPTIDTLTPNTASIAASPTVAITITGTNFLREDFVMVDGGVSAIRFDGNIVGVSKPVPKKDGRLEFPHPDENGTTVSPAKVYCKLVSS